MITVISKDKEILVSTLEEAEVIIKHLILEGEDPQEIRIEEKNE